MKIYLSAPVFTQVQRQWNRRLADALEESLAGVAVVLPQDFKFEGAYNRPEDFRKLYKECVDLLEDSDVVVAVLDGPDVDSGVAFELGYAVARGIPVIGIRTDYRESQDRGLNLMLSNACDELLREMSFSEDLGQLVRDLVGKIVAALKNIGH